MKQILERIRKRWEHWMADIFHKKMIRWENKRKNKRKYILKHGLHSVLYIALIGYGALSDRDLSQANSNWIILLVFLIVAFFLIGCSYGLSSFKTNESAYQYYCKLGTEATE